jgi:hypothetical protein
MGAPHPLLQRLGIVVVAGPFLLTVVLGIPALLDRKLAQRATTRRRSAAIRPAHRSRAIARNVADAWDQETWQAAVERAIDEAIAGGGAVRRRGSGAGGP